MLKGGDGKVTQREGVGGNAEHKKIRRDEKMEEMEMKRERHSEAAGTK